MKVTMKQIIHFNEIRPSIFGTHFEPSTDVLLCCVRKIEEKEWESYFDGVAEAAALFHQTCRSHFSHPIYRILNFTPARTLNNWAKGKSHLFSLPIYSSISNLFHNLWSKIADEKGLSKVPPSKLFPQHKENGKEETRRAVCIQHFFNLLFSVLKWKLFQKQSMIVTAENISFKRMFFPRFLTYNFSSSFLETDCMMCFLIKSGKKGKMKSGIWYRDKWWDRNWKSSLGWALLCVIDGSLLRR